VLALEHLIEHPADSLTMNCGYGQGYSVLEVLDAVDRVTNNKITRVLGPRRAGDPAVLIASSDRIRRDLGWRPRYPHLYDIIETAWRWHSTHPNGYGDRQ
jgi:UDP-glucose 4-epimerase